MLLAWRSSENFLQQRHVTRLSFGSNLFEVDHQAAVFVSGEKRINLLPETRTRASVIQERCDVDPIYAIGIVYRRNTSMPVSSDFRNFMTLSSTGWMLVPWITSKYTLVWSSTPCR